MRLLTYKLQMNATSQDPNQNSNVQNYLDIRTYITGNGNFNVGKRIYYLI